MRWGRDGTEYTPRRPLDVPAHSLAAAPASLKVIDDVATTRLRKKQRDDFGTVYRGHEGQWSWMFHRITGVAVILYLFAHVVDTALVGWGPEAYDRVVDAYKNPAVHVLELGLVLAVLFHSINGIKITLIDFFPRLAAHIRAVGRASMLVFVASALVVTAIMGRQILDQL
jgi:succinate dehydrogenase / fumarate reductase, cytochrome b subunit